MSRLERMGSDKTPTRPLLKIGENGIQKIAILVVIAGILFRFRQFFEVRALWGDEAMLALNVITYGYADLIFKPLAFHQVAPPGFILLNKLFVQIGGANELSLRFASLLFGIATLIIAYISAKRLFHSSWILVLTVSLFAFSPLLIYYSCELKQYGSDAFWALFCLYIYQKYHARELSIKSLTVSGLVAIMFSHSICFVLSAIGIFDFFRATKQLHLKRMAWIAMASIIWLAWFIMIFRLSMPTEEGTGYMQSYWATAFPPLDNTLIQWIQSCFSTFSTMGFIQSRPVGIDDLNTWSVRSALESSLFFILLIICLKGTHKLKPTLAILCLATFIHLAVSFFEVYPFGSRLLIYLLPFVYLLVVRVFEYGTQSHYRGLKCLSFISVSFIVLLQLGFAVTTFIKPTNFADIRIVLDHVRQNHIESDKIAVSQGIYPAFFYYSTIYGFSVDSCDLISEKSSTEGFVHQFEGSDRVWTLFTHHKQEVPTFLREAIDYVELSSSYEVEELGVYLFDFKNVNEH